MSEARDVRIGKNTELAGKSLPVRSHVRTSCRNNAKAASRSLDQKIALFVR
jgi:hypothetical protein